MAFGSPSHNEIPKYVLGMPLNILGNPLRGTEPTLLPTWQQTYAPSTPYNAVAAHAPSHSFHQPLVYSNIILHLLHPKAKPEIVGYRLEVKWAVGIKSIL